MDAANHKAPAVADDPDAEPMILAATLESNLAQKIA